MNCELRAAREDVERLAKLAERERIARDLHDVLGHTLSVIVLKSELAAKLSDSDATRAATEIRDVERIARESLSDLREALAGYRAAGVAAEIERARSVLTAAGVRFEMRRWRRPPHAPHGKRAGTRYPRSGDQRRAPCRRNVRAGSHLAADSLGCRFEIADDGRGLGANEGLGLRGMRERVEALGGTFVRESASAPEGRESKAGTRLVLTLPATAH